MKEIAIAAVSLLVGAIVGPYINWGIEKRKQKLVYQREQISKWRVMVAEVAQQRGTSGTLMELLERREEFHSLKGHLSQKVIGELHRPHTVVVGSTIEAGLTCLADDITKLETEWKLI